MGVDLLGNRGLGNLRGVILDTLEDPMPIRLSALSIAGVISWSNSGAVASPTAASSASPRRTAASE